MWIATAALAALTAAAGGVAAPPNPAGIVGGERTDRCGWPTVVSLGRVCTGTLVHPSVVVYAAHCGDAFPSVELGSAIAPRHVRTVATQHCETWPGGFLPGAGRDWAFCVLSSPQDDLPIVPPLMGCETAALVPGAPVTLVGFGESEVGYGDKRAVETRFQSWNGDEIELGGEGRDSCEGDSGGPAFVQLPSGHWRTFGIVSYGETCGDGGFVSLMHLATPWVETRSGYDISPCFDADGTWNPTAECADFSSAPDDGRGVWISGCEQPLEIAPLSCGPSFDAQGDQDPPLVQFVDAPQTVDPGTYEIEVRASDDGSGLHTIRMTIDGLPIETGTAWSDEALFEVELRSGEHQLRAVATDHAGNTSDTTVTVLVSDDPSDMGIDAGESAGCRTTGPPTNFDILFWGWMFSLGWKCRRSRRTCYPS